MRRRREHDSRREGEGRGRTGEARRSVIRKLLGDDEGGGKRGRMTMRMKKRGRHTNETSR